MILNYYDGIKIQRARGRQYRNWKLSVCTCACI